MKSIWTDCTGEKKETMLLMNYVWAPTKWMWLGKGSGWGRPRSSRPLAYTAWGTYSCWQETAFSQKALTLQMRSVIWILSRNPGVLASGSRGRPWLSPFGQSVLEVLWLVLWSFLRSYLRVLTSGPGPKLSGWHSVLGQPREAVNRGT